MLDDDDPGDASDNRALCSSTLKPGDWNLMGETSGERKPNPNRLIFVGEEIVFLTGVDCSGE